MPPLLYETHMHTPLCKHAVGEVGAYAAVAELRGLRGITVTCHNPMPDSFGARVRMSIDEFPRYIEMVAEAREEWRDRVDVRLGFECDYFPGYETWLHDQIASADFHYILGSVHPQLPEFRARFWRNDALALWNDYFDQLATAAETGLYDCISHPDLVKNVTPTVWSVDIAMDAIRRALDRIAATGVSMELNTSGVNKSIPEMNPSPTMLAEMRERNIPVVIGADAHEPGRVGDGFDEALNLLAAAGYATVGYFLNRKRVEVAIEDALASLNLDQTLAT